MSDFTLKDRVVQYPNRYELTNISGDIYDITPSPGVVTEEGTPINKATIDNVIAGITEVVGTYVGDGEASRTITLGFTPSAVLLKATNSTSTYNPAYNPYFAVTGAPSLYSGKMALEIVPNGFSVFYSPSDGVVTNFNNREYAYIVWK